MRTKEEQPGQSDADFAFIEDENGGEAPLPDNITRLSRRKRRRHPHWGRRVALLLLLVLLGLLIWLNRARLTPAALTDSVQSFLGGFGPSRFPVSYSQGDFKTAVPLGNNIGVLTDSAFLIYSPAGRELAERQHGLGSPQAVSAGGYAVLYDDGGTQLKVETRFAETCSLTEPYAITGAAVNASGRFAVVTASHDYLSEMTICSPDGKQVFKWYSAEGRIVAATLSADGTRAAALALTSSGGDVLTSLVIYNLDSKTPIAKKDLPGIFLFSLQYKSDGTLEAVGDTCAMRFDAAGSSAATYDYGGRTLKCYANTADATALVFSRYGVGRVTALVSLGADGTVSGQADLSDDVESLSAEKNGIAALSPDGITKFNARCASPAQAKAQTGINRIELLNGHVYGFAPGAVYQCS